MNCSPSSAPASPTRRQPGGTGVVTEHQAQWLIAHADECASANALAALVAVLAGARRAPAWFVEAVRARGSRGWTGVEAALEAAKAG
jgi:hypothetical protein